MKILYTGALKQDTSQIDPNISLGGLVSNSIIPNDDLSNIFSAVSLISIQNKRKEIKMIAIKNDENDILTDLTFTFTLDTNSICNYKIAFVNPSIGADHFCFETIPNPTSTPYYANFQPILNNVEFNISLLETNSYLGIWLMREYDYDSIGLKSKTCMDWNSLLDNPVTENDTESILLNIKYTIGEPSISNSNSSSISNSIS